MKEHFETVRPSMEADSMGGFSPPLSVILLTYL